VARLVERYYGVPWQSIDVVHCGVDTDVFHPGPDQATPARPTVLFVGSVVENKGAQVLVEAVIKLRKKYPDIRLLMVGKGGPSLMEQLTERIHNEGAEPNIEFLGFIDLEKLPAYYRSAHVFCSPSAEYEGFGQVYIEAMACGCPVVASTAGGAPEAVVQGETGLLVPPNDVAATAEALDQILSDTEFRRRLSHHGRQRIDEYFAMDRFVHRVEAVYEKAILRSQASPERLQDERE
jgi:glycosyltransferase involved in cell wall biosynthesis